MKNLKKKKERSSVTLLEAALADILFFLQLREVKKKHDELRLLA